MARIDSKCHGKIFPRIKRSVEGSHAQHQGRHQIYKENNATITTNSNTTIITGGVPKHVNDVIILRGRAEEQTPDKNMITFPKARS